MACESEHEQQVEKTLPALLSDVEILIHVHTYLSKFLKKFRDSQNLNQLNHLDSSCYTLGKKYITDSTIWNAGQEVNEEPRVEVNFCNVLFIVQNHIIVSYMCNFESYQHINKEKEIEYDVKPVMKHASAADIWDVSVSTKCYFPRNRK